MSDGERKLTDAELVAMASQVKALYDIVRGPLLEVLKRIERKLDQSAPTDPPLRDRRPTVPAREGEQERVLDVYGR